MKLVYLPATALRHLADYSRSHYFVHVPYGVTVDDIMRPAFWAHHANKLKALDVVEVVAEDGSFDLELRVLDAQVGYVKMRLLRAWADEAQARVTAARVAEDDERERKALKERFPCVRYTKLQRWHVIGHDGNVVKDGYLSRLEAQNALNEYVARSAASEQKNDAA